MPFRPQHAAPYLAGLTLALLAPPALAQPATADPGATDQADRDDIRRARAQKRLRDRARDAGDIERLLPPVDASLVGVFDDTVNELASDRMGGRAPGTDGIEHAAVLIENRFRALGLDPAFTTQTEEAPAPTYRQPFERGTDSTLKSSSISINGAPALEFDTDYTVLGLSGSADFEGPVSFVGYSVVSGPGGYLNYPAGKKLDGRAAIVVRFEPHDEDGNSKWAAQGWSFSAALQAKIGAAARRGAGAVLLVNPASANDPRVTRLENMDSSRGSTTFDIPVLMITPEHADALVRAGDPQGRSLDDLIALANNEGTVVDLDDDVTIAASTNIEEISITTDNVGAVLPGRGALADEYVVIGAHYDHVGLGHFASRSPDRAGEIHRGADDNASGTSGMLLAAELLAERYADLPAGDDARSVVFLAFSAEESGLIGSRYYAEHPPFPIDAHAAMLNMDMIGRLRSYKLEVGGTSNSPDLETIARPHLDASGLDWEFDLSIGAGRSDHASFDAVGVPCMFVFTGLHDEYHTADDTPDLVNDEGAVRVVNIVADIVYDLATRADRPTHEDAGPSRGIGAQRRPKVRIGIIPADAPTGGLRIDRVFDDTSAFDAGLQQGDVVTAWDGKDIDSVDAWMPVLLDHNPGDKVTLTVIRDGEEIELDMTLKEPG